MNEPLPGSGADGAPEPIPADAPPADPSSAFIEPVPPVPAAPVEPGGGTAPAETVRPAAEVPPAAETVRRQNRVAVAGTVLLVVALAFGAGIAIGRASAPAGEGASSPVAGAASPGTAGASASTGAPASPGASAVAGGPSPVSIPGRTVDASGPRLGSANAPVVVEYWADYQCPFCGKFALEILPQLESRIADGEVALVHRDFAFLGQESFDAAVAVRCAGQQGKYWTMHDAVYLAQNGENKGAFAPANLKAIATAVGLDQAKYDACIADPSVLVDVYDDTAAGHRAGVTSTPTVDVNGTRLSGISTAAPLLAAIDAAAAPGATPGTLPTGAPVKNDPWAGTPMDGRTAGKPTAPVTVELWMDYQSTGYKDLVDSLEGDLRTRATDGKVQLVLKDLALLGSESETAAAAVRCTADQAGPAWLVHDVLAVNAKGQGSGLYVPDTLVRLAFQLNMRVRDFATCITDPSVIQAVRDETAQGKAMGLTEGPSIVVRQGDKELGRFSGTIDPKKVLAAIDGAK